jgi:serine/threonine protein kinase
VYDQARYDPRSADIWSIAIIFCCMTLRRFPWKAPRISDNSYRLFVSPPDPDQDKLLEQHRKSLQARSEPATRNPSVADGAHHNNQRAQDDNGHNKESASRQTTQSDSNAQPTIKGPLRLLRLLPRESRHIIGRMLELDPKRRAMMDEILQDPWVQNSLVCRQEENGVIIKAPNHTHTLQPSGAGSK